MEIRGKYNTALVFTEKLEKTAHDQIKILLDLPYFADSSIKIMPDVHSGAGCVIGLTMHSNKYIVPDLIGVDIGCGMLTLSLEKKAIYDYRKIDQFIHNSIPSGFSRNKRINELLIKPNSGLNRLMEKEKLSPSRFLENVRKIAGKIGLNPEEQIKSLGSLGGGNHFIEIDKTSSGSMYCVIHSGSRNFGYQVAHYHQLKAGKYCEKKGISLPASLCFLEDELKNRYLDDMKIAQIFAKTNRYLISQKILNFLEQDPDTENFETIHNYYNFKDNIIRKGAVSAYKDEKILIPFNMRDGSIIALGKGEKDWNFSAPHGAGRILSRTQAKKRLSLETFRKSMEGIYTTTCTPDTLDEAPQAYKPIDELLDILSKTVIIKEFLKPQYNFKAAE